MLEVDASGFTYAENNKEVVLLAQKSIYFYPKLASEIEIVSLV
jgi:uncharacterized protein (DUF1015 family)